MLGLFEIDKDPPRGGLSLSVRVILKALQTDSRIPPPSRIRTFIIILKLLKGSLMKSICIAQNSNFVLYGAGREGKGRHKKKSIFFRKKS